MGTKKVIVLLPEEQIEFLCKVAEEEHITFTDVLRRAINSEKFFVDQEKSGRKILIEEQGKLIREVLRK